MSIPQSGLMCKLMPRFESAKAYRKSLEVHARNARPGEVVHSVTSDGAETKNTAAKGDKVVMNLTDARECYVVPADRFEARYDEVEDLGNGWTRCRPRGRVLAIEITPAVRDLLGVAAKFHIEAPWGEAQVARSGDYLVTPLPAKDEIYRIAKQEFEQTYSLDER